MDLELLVSRRRSVRDFDPSPLEEGLFLNCVNLATRSPNAGNSQGWHLVSWEGEETARYWDVALPRERRGGFAWPGLLRAPVLALVGADPEAYLSRYSEPDKSATGWGGSTAAWPAPYWTVDAAFATMTLMLLLEERGLGTLFFAHAREAELRREFEIPAHIVLLGVLATGRPADAPRRSGRSAGRARRSADEIVHRERW